MHPGLKDKRPLRLRDILDQPREVGGKREGGVIGDADQHGRGTQGIKVVQTLVGRGRLSHG